MLIAAASGIEIGPRTTRHKLVDRMASEKVGWGWVSAVARAQEELVEQAGRKGYDRRGGSTVGNRVEALGRLAMSANNAWISVGKSPLTLVVRIVWSGLVVSHVSVVLVLLVLRQSLLLLSSGSGRVRGCSCSSLGVVDWSSRVAAGSVRVVSLKLAVAQCSVRYHKRKETRGLTLCATP